MAPITQLVMPESETQAHVIRGPISVLDFLLRDTHEKLTCTGPRAIYWRTLVARPDTGDWRPAPWVESRIWYPGVAWYRI
jgi:hypothetical protein